jgi:hypothetical protein
MSWKARDWTGCFVAALAAAVAGAVFGRMMGLDRGGLGQGWMKMGIVEMKEVPHFYCGVVSFLPLLVMCVILRLTLFKEFPAPRRQRAIVFSMMLGPMLAIGAVVALVLTASGLGYSDLLEYWADGWSATLRSAARGRLPDFDREITFIVVTTFVQGAVLGAVSGGWFAESPGATSNRRPRNLVLAMSGILVVLFCAASVLVESEKKGYDRARCILNCRNVQQAMRSCHSMNGHNPGDVLPTFGASTLVGPGLFVESMPVCPAGYRYKWVEGRVPVVGELMIRCSCPEHVPTGIEDW